MTGEQLTRRMTGLSPAHVELIKLVAEVAVANYLHEIESDEAVQKNGELHKDMA